MDFVGGRIKGYCGPKELEAPDDLERVIVDFIDQATATIDVAMQEIDNEAIAEALIRRRLGGCHVRVILNHDYLREEGKAAQPRSGGRGIAALSADKTKYKINRDIFSALCRCGIEVRIDLNPDAIFHHKFCLTDYRLTRDGDPRSGDNPAVLSGSANFTVTDCHNNLNHVLVFEDAAIQAEFAIEFAEAWSGEFGRGRLGKPPRTVDVDGVPVKVLFSPDHGPEAEIVKQVLKCPKGGRIDCAMFTFAGTSAIDDAMIVMVEAGRAVRVVLDRGQSRPTATWPAARWLKRGGVDVRVPKQRAGLRKLHHKLGVIDGSTVVAGSYNYSEPATLFNDEALLVIGSTHSESEHVEVDRAACERIAKFFGDEIERIAADSAEWKDAA